VSKSVHTPPNPYTIGLIFITHNYGEKEYRIIHKQSEKMNFDKIIKLS
jgi:hypothetical protein